MSRARRAARYRLDTTATLKERDHGRWWIDKNIVKPVVVTASSITDALKQYRDVVNKQYYVSISDNALKAKRGMYIDLAGGGSDQIGYVITGATDFDTDNGKCVKRYVDLWISIVEEVNPFDKECVILRS